MSGPQLEQLSVGDGASARHVAVLDRDGKNPGLFWLSGYRSDMSGTKAAALDRWAQSAGQSYTRFDYSGHGRSGGKLEDCTISHWLEEAEAVLDAYTAGPQIVIGSSMGGWLALLLARRLRERSLSDRLAGMILIAPALDMTKDLMADRFDDAARRALAENGFCAQPSAYSGEPYVITRTFLEDGERHLFGEQPIEAGCPVHVIQGMEDNDVPWRHATKLMERLAFDDAVLTLVRDGDHRLSRPEDIERLIRVVEEIVKG